MARRRCAGFGSASDSHPVRQLSRAASSSRQAASSSSGTPAPVTPEIRKKGSRSFEARRLQRCHALLIVERIDLVRGDDLRLGGKRRLEELELLADRVEIAAPDRGRSRSTRRRDG